MVIALVPAPTTISDGRSDKNPARNTPRLKGALFLLCHTPAGTQAARRLSSQPQRAAITAGRLIWNK